jgi:hypothetical protein
MSSDEDTFFGIPNPLKDSGNQAAVEDETPLPDDLENDATTTATVAYVKDMMRKHRQTCPAIRKLRKWAMVASMLLGVILALNVCASIFGRAWIRQAVREGVREELRDRGLASISPGEAFFELEKEIGE